MKHALPILLCLVASGSCFADNIAYTIVGTLPSAVASSSMTDPNASFTLSFSLPVKPKSVSAGFNGGSFSVITDAAFTSGTNTSLISNAQIGFYSDAMGGGLFARLFNGVDHLNLSLGGPSLFTGPGATPTFLAGIFTMDAGGYSAVGLNTSNYNIPHALTGQTLVMARVVGVPEPGESMMSAMALGLAVFASKLLRDRANYRFAGNKTSSRVSARMNSSK